MLEQSEIARKNIVQYSHVNGRRGSTYDATVGTIIKRGKIQGSSYVLKPRGVVWVVSQEEFHMPNNVTALATVRTTWAHKGVFALNVGVVDPGWKGPVATALVNFSMEDFEVKIGEGFMRLIFTEHTPSTSVAPLPIPRDQYVKDIQVKSLDFADSFLNVNSLVDEVAKEIFKLGKITRAFAIAGLLATLLSIFGPIAFSAWIDGMASRAIVSKLEQRVEQLEEVARRHDSHPIPTGETSNRAAAYESSAKNGANASAPQEAASSREVNKRTSNEKPTGTSRPTAKSD